MKNLFSFKLPSRWTTFPMIYGDDQIIAEVSSWTITTRIWVNDEIVDKKSVSRVQTIDKEKARETHTFRLPNGKEIILTTGVSLLDGMLFCSAEADGSVFYEKSFSEPEGEPEPESLTSILITFIPAGIISGLAGYFVTQFILGAF
ncbi:MAG: hypothetical protein AAF296_05085 [Pseudomonadota bacterium]